MDLELYKHLYLHQLSLKPISELKDYLKKMKVPLEESDSKDTLLKRAEIFWYLCHEYDDEGEQPLSEVDASQTPKDFLDSLYNAKANYEHFRHN